MFFPGTPNIFVPSDSAFMLFKCMSNSIFIEKTAAPVFFNSFQA